MNDESDAELYRRALNGDRSAVRAIVERYHADLVRHANAKTNNRTAAQDAVANAWIRLFEHLKKAAENPTKALAKPESLRFWLLAATRNSLMDIFRRQKRDADLADKIKREEGADGGLAYQPDFLERLTDDERRRTFMRAFQNLSDKCRELLSLLLMDPPMEYVDVADTLGMKLGSIGPTRQRCIDSLRSWVLE